MMVLQSHLQPSDPASLGKYFLEDQHQGINVDFILLSGGKKLLVHSLMLRNASPSLKALIDTSCSCFQPDAIFLPQKYSSVLSHFVDLLYTGSSFLPKNLIPPLKELTYLLGIVNVSLDENVPQNNEASDNDETENPDDQIPFKLCTQISRGSQKPFTLSLPQSRMTRNFSNLKHLETLEGFNGRVQEEYNKCPIGEYAGPYDLNEKLKLDILLPNTNLDYLQYSDFIHPENVSCRVFHVEKGYENLSDLDKIDALNILKSDDCASDDQSGDSNDEDTGKVYYTCQKKKCRIPCPCAPCCTQEKQCPEHKVKHLQLFDDKEHSIVIRSSEDFCRDESFFDTSYIIKFAGIPLNCSHCQKDLLHHKLYHISFHDDCKFCKQNWFKLFAKDRNDLHEREKKERDYYRTVCPHCDKKFCEPASAKKHIELAHNQSPFTCEVCSTSFHSKQAKEYHNTLKHSTSKASEKCDVCHKVLASKISLRNHMMYVHSEERKFECKSCDQKFKQKKSLKKHYLQVHSINQYQEMYHEPESEMRYSCEQCGSHYKQKATLNHHIRQKHNQHIGKSDMTCNQCPSKFKEKKSLISHVKLQHGEPSVDFKCTECGKLFNQKKNLNKHKFRFHKT